MCGIAGELTTDREPDLPALARMSEALAARGPDGSGVWGSSRCGLAHRRLSIIDLSRCGSQPMVDSELGLVIVFNGCIYNYRELRGELQAAGYRFFSTSDTEVVLKAYHHWGDGFVEHLLGMFAFALYERDSGRLVLVRDRLGIKPLYLAEVDGALRFASTLPALLAGGVTDTEIDAVALHHYLSWHTVVPAPRTILAGVRKLAPASIMIVEPDGRRREHCYWEPLFTRDGRPPELGADGWRDAVLEALRTAISRRMVSDVPVGVLLSGGLDSSLIVALLAEQGQSGLATFSIGFESVGGQDGHEFEYSDLIADRFATDHTRFLVGGDDMLAALPEAIAAMSEPMMSHDVVAFYLLAQEVARTRKVVQSGQGADEVFAGYSWYPPLADADGTGAETYEREFFDRTHDEMKELLEPARVAGSDVSSEFVQAHFDRRGAETALDRALRLDTEIMLVDDPVKRVDNMTMAWGLEARTPFLDHELVELAAACPPDLKLAHGGKGVLKAAARGVVPDEVIDRKKGYFPVPALKHLEGAALEMISDSLTSRRARDRGLFRQPYLERLLAKPNDHPTTLGGSKLWQLGVLEMWLQAHGI
jgi:asparagine synthase (glutamine-hydrolysing)